MGLLQVNQADQDQMDQWDLLQVIWDQDLMDQWDLLQEHMGPMGPPGTRTSSGPPPGDMAGTRTRMGPMGPPPGDMGPGGPMGPPPGDHGTNGWTRDMGPPPGEPWDRTNDGPPPGDMDQWMDQMDLLQVNQVDQIHYLVKVDQLVDQDHQVIWEPPGDPMGDHHGTSWRRIWDQGISTSSRWNG